MRTILLKLLAYASRILRCLDAAPCAEGVAVLANKITKGCSHSLLPFCVPCGNTCRSAEFEHLLFGTRKKGRTCPPPLVLPDYIRMARTHCSSRRKHLKSCNCSSVRPLCITIARHGAPSDPSTLTRASTESKQVCNSAQQCCLLYRVWTASPPSPDSSRAMRSIFSRYSTT